MAQTPVQVTGRSTEASYAAGQTAGFIGWSPTAAADVLLHTVTGGAVKGTWTTLTAYAIGDVVTYSGVRYQAVQTVASSNTFPPPAGGTWRLADDKRGAAQVANQLFRTYR